MRGGLQKTLKASKEELLQIIDTWAEAERLEVFLADAERRAQNLPDEQRERAIERLRRARALIGSTDALERFGAWRAPEEDKIGPNLAGESADAIWGHLWGHVLTFKLRLLMFFNMLGWLFSSRRLHHPQGLG